jgi:hypothetical protein
MKLLTRLRELRDEHITPDLMKTDDEHLESIGVGTTTVDDIIRLNLEHINLQEQTPRAHFVF